MARDGGPTRRRPRILTVPLCAIDTLQSSAVYVPLRQVGKATQVAEKLNDYTVYSPEDRELRLGDAHAQVRLGQHSRVSKALLCGLWH
eukprot:scaffold7729_cov120-Isochrysis_galbana.AAC.10